MTCICDMHGRGGYHCRACCLTFGGIDGFDRHIVRGTHIHPSERGLVLAPSGKWIRPNFPTPPANSGIAA
jgi:hypothetical protein